MKISWEKDVKNPRAACNHCNSLHFFLWVMMMMIPAAALLYIIGAFVYHVMGG